MISFAAVAQTLLPGLFNLIDKIVPDKDLAEKIKRETQDQVMKGEMQGLEIASKLVMGEIKGDSMLQRNWRPLLMVVVIGIIANNYVLAPYVSLLFGVDVIAELPERLWDLMTLGVGGYVVGRSGEKMVKAAKLPPISLRSVDRDGFNS